jgi:hypothetical protein
MTTNLLPVIRWTVVTNLTATGSTLNFDDSNGVTNGVMRFYRVVRDGAP